ncbi:trypsin-like peptidase domain-containing protein [Streptomyces phaeochromogenes]|uniref:Trypsin-like peptidase domain-containing protein n=1 Tax=Streptomyces phaeochromogenes TaxID=1923 RepID=A0ABZ1HKK5_STRPH|nr:trypsin-like peptidase domain-containing protein [Streptomyces phaeochromogenes]MCX5597804.1 trypsin-like peptidase domain-containing protein [Streptomyces phaeochromogenes]WSD18740.1 trypsin-like peptidase domain-containing protein [Streptomyces phaeochromogenes]
MLAGPSGMTSARSPESLAPAVARLRGHDGAPVGTGFLLAPGTVATCAHVVARALRTDERETQAPSGPVTVEFPMRRGSSAYRAEVTAWCPVAADGSGDIALLRLTEPVAAPATAGRATLDGMAPVPLAGAADVWDHRFRVLAFPATADHGAWIGGRLRGGVGQGWISMEADGSAHRISPGCSGAPVWDEELGGVVGMTVAVDGGISAVTSYLIPAAALLDLQPGLRRCPYRGLDAFREEDAEYFFGREQETEQLLDAVERHLLVPVVGPSGSGKTSLVRAGVLPRLCAQGYTVSEIRPLPGTRPSLTLARALTPLLEPGLGAIEEERHSLALADLLASGAGPEARTFGLRLLNHCGPYGHVFFLNQFEEIVAAEPEAARALLGLVVDTASAPADGKRLRILATLRSASLDDLVAPATARILSDCAQVVAPLERAGLLRAVEGPAARVPGLTFEPGLAERIVDDAEGEPGHLPLVEFALTELWACEQGLRSSTALTHAGYEALGGVAGALSAHAEQRVGEVIAEHGEGPVRRLFVQLGRPDDSGGFTRRPACLAPLAPPVQAAAEALAGRTRFVRITHGPEGEGIADLAHEELVRAWPRLGAWLDATRDFRSWQERLRQAFDHWKDTGEESGALLRGTMLATSLEQLADPVHRDDITHAERLYIDLSRRHEERGLRRWRLTAAVLVVLALIAGGLAVEALRRGSALEERARASASRLLAGHAERMKQEDPVTSVRLALAAWHNAPTQEARQALLHAYLAGTSVAHGYAGQGSEEIRGFDMTPDGSAVATATTDGAGAGHARVWSGLFEGRPQWWQVPGLPRGTPTAAELSDDGRLLAIASDDGSVIVWDVKDRERLWRKSLPDLGVPELPETVALDFSDDGGRLLRLAAVDTADAAGQVGSSLVQVWGSRRGEPVRMSQKGVPEGPEAADAALLGDGSSAVYLRSDSHEPTEVQVRGLASGAVRGTFPDGRWIARKGTDIVTEGKHGRYSLVPADQPGSARDRRVLAVEPCGPDVTGRYVVEVTDLGVSAAFSVTDLTTGKRHRALFSPVARDMLFTEATQYVAVLPGGKGSPRVLLVVGSDMVVLRTEAAHRLPLPDVVPGWSSSDTYVRSDDGLYRAQLSRNDRTSGAEPLVLARRGAESQAEPIVVAELEEGSIDAVFTKDGRYLVLWGGDVVSARSSVRPGTALVRHFPGPQQVLPVYGSTVVVITRDQLIRYDVASGRRKVLVDSLCGGVYWACRAVAVRPGDRNEVAVADKNGKVVFWDVASGAARDDTGIMLSGGGEFDAKALVFDPHGDLVAGSLGSGTVVRWRTESGRRVGSTIQAGASVAAYALADDGTLLVEEWEGELQLWRPEDTDEAFVTFPFSVDEADIHLTGDHLTLEQANTGLRVPLSPDAWHTALCRSWIVGYTPAEKRVLTESGASMEAPCP